ncbi:hypothetical protein [Streptomyces adustus]|uniref:hypothetical protein n=1 Tax=Streptomyces adustus TaxID=1609272 RepID=UPI00192E6431|nr:hypothetical protein [Streptomyces adustus]
MTHWFRRHLPTADAWLYFEIDSRGGLARHIELRGPLERPVTAASSSEWRAARRDGRLDAYEATFGSLTEILLEPDDARAAQPLTAHDFEAVWRAARAICEARSRAGGSGRRPAVAPGQLGTRATHAADACHPRGADPDPMPPSGPVSTP